MNLKNRWFYLTGKYNSDTVLIDALYSELAGHYNEPHRAYHTLTHIDKLLQLSDVYASSLKNKDLVDFSIFFHDLIYRPGRSDNEEESTGIAKEWLKKLDVSAQLVNNVTAFIAATKNHNVTGSAAQDLTFFLDFDLSILAAPEEEYKAYATAIREEFSVIPDLSYAFGRTTFLQSLLAKPHIFFTDAFRSREMQARKNIQNEIADLTRHI